MHEYSFEQWKGFRKGVWQNKIDVRNFYLKKLPRI